MTSPCNTNPSDTLYHFKHYPDKGYNRLQTATLIDTYIQINICHFTSYHDSITKNYTLYLLHGFTPFEPLCLTSSKTHTGKKDKLLHLPCSFGSPQLEVLKRVSKCNIHVIIIPSWWFHTVPSSISIAWYGLCLRSCYQSGPWTNKVNLIVLRASDGTIKSGL